MSERAERKGGGGLRKTSIRDTAKLTIILIFLDGSGSRAE